MKFNVIFTLVPFPFPLVWTSTSHSCLELEPRKITSAISWECEWLTNRRQCLDLDGYFCNYCSIRRDIFTAKICCFKKRFFLFHFSAICDTEPEQPIRNCPLWIKVEGEIDPEPIYIPTPSVIEPVKPLVLPTPELLPSSKNKSSNGVKPGRVYTPKPNPVVSKERKMLYFQRKRAKPPCVFKKTNQPSLKICTNQYLK